MMMHEMQRDERRTMMLQGLVLALGVAVLGFPDPARAQDAIERPLTI